MVAWRLMTLPPAIFGRLLIPISGRSSSHWQIHFIARPCQRMIWQAITQEVKSDTNYKLESGDRLYVGSPPPKK
jgi:hypothetical protein